MVGFNSVIALYQQSGLTESNCGDITFINTGTQPVTINAALRLLSNQSFTFAAQVGEINKTVFRFTFDPDPSYTNSLTVIKKYFIDK